MSSAGQLRREQRASALFWQHHHLLIDQVRKEDGGRNADAAIPASQGPLELQYEARGEQGTDVWQLAVDDGHQGSKDWSVGGGSNLRTDQAATEQPLATYQVLQVAQTSHELLGDMGAPSRT